MARKSSIYVCQQCGATSPGYLGRCPSCSGWNTMVETIEAKPGKGLASATLATRSAPVALDDVSLERSNRILSGIGELDRVLGGGLVPGSVALIGGDPGIGKSTLVLQAAVSIAAEGAPVLYATGEESAQQIRLRADRLSLMSGNVSLLAEPDLSEVLGAAESMQPGLLIVDSIQTATVADLESAAGSVGQVRESAARIINWAKPRQVPALIVGHVTKEGTIAGPRVLEHMV
ncbi:MAG: DNA repair protein RadA, partial [Thermomicrobiales bacterium]|nr:DNA repair protein RadA [Thermomicrobiales bacterium]